MWFCVHPTVIYYSWCNCWCMWSCEDFQIETTLGNVSCGFILRFCIVQASPRQAIFIDFLDCSFSDLCPGHCWSRSAWNFGTPAMRWQLESNSQVTTVCTWPSASVLSFVCVLQGWQNMYSIGKWMDSPFEQMMYLESGYLYIFVENFWNTLFLAFKLIE